MSDNNPHLGVLHDHYKDTSAVIRERERERDRLFLVLIAVLGVLGVQVGYPAESGGLVEQVSAGSVRVAVGALPAAAVLTATWVLIFAIGLRYAQRTIIIERQYDYLHTLEKHIAGRLDDAPFQREGTAYLGEYPAFSDWAWVSYVVVFPIVVVLAVVGLIVMELARLAYPAVHKLFDAAMAVAVIVSMYLYRLHPPTIILERLRRLGAKD